MREYAEEDGYRRWPRRRVDRKRSTPCKAEVMGALEAQQRHVREYLELLRADGTAPGDPDADTDSGRTDAEDAFTRVARSFGRRHGIDIETWLEVRVPLDVLRRAGFRLPDSSIS
ncbi:MAG: hypothetical protein HKN44_04250 [Ilumatobacter sp.]|nr:hypothetical protein [Ilumatobacter sp.]